MAAANLIENRTFDEIAVGDTASLTARCPPTTSSSSRRCQAT
jgi:hypothetical protein